MQFQILTTDPLSIDPKGFFSYGEAATFEEAWSMARQANLIFLGTTKVVDRSVGVIETLVGGAVA